MTPDLIGWDVGGAHLKAVAINRVGRVLGVVQEPCPLWLGLDRLESALARVTERLRPGEGCCHAVTMTGELADCFADRDAGVLALVRVMGARFGPDAVTIFAGPEGFIAADRVRSGHVKAIASANWMASAMWAASRVRDALFVDVGSTTTDILAISEHRVRNRGYTDHERMRYDELLYSGVVRSPLMALADRGPLAGEWSNLMAEHFATTADVYRLSGELPESADQHPAADGGPKTLDGSRRRLARMFGLDAAFLPPDRWRQVALFFRERQLERIRMGLELQLSRGLWAQNPVLLGAGTGRFLVQEQARRMQFEYLNFSEMLVLPRQEAELGTDDCAPAAALACLALREVAGR